MIFVWLLATLCVGGVAYNLEGMVGARRPDFETTARAEMPVLYRVARRMTRSEDEAADLVQSTLIKALRAWKAFDGSRPRPWLLKILQNEARMKYRSDARTATLQIEDVEVADEGVWDQLHWRNQKERLLTELENLPEDFKMTITLCDLEQLSYEEAAEAMDVPIGTVRSRLFRARNLLRARLIEAPVEVPR